MFLKILVCECIGPVCEYNLPKWKLWPLQSVFYWYLRQTIKKRIRASTIATSSLTFTPLGRNWYQYRLSLWKINLLKISYMEKFSVKNVKTAESRQKMVEFLSFAVKVMFGTTLLNKLNRHSAVTRIVAWTKGIGEPEIYLQFLLLSVIY